MVAEVLVVNATQGLANLFNPVGFGVGLGPRRRGLGLGGFDQGGVFSVGGQLDVAGFPFGPGDRGYPFPVGGQLLVHRLLDLR